MWICRARAVLNERMEQIFSDDIREIHTKNMLIPYATITNFTNLVLFRR